MYVAFTMQQLFHITYSYLYIHVYSRILFCMLCGVRLVYSYTVDDLPLPPYKLVIFLCSTGEEIMMPL